MARGDRREEIFRDDRDQWKFLGYLAEGAERYRVKVYCYVLMENHFHLVVMTPEGNLSQWMHQLKTAYTVYFNRRHQVVGHLFQGRFKSTVIEAEKYLLEVSRYLHLNPVRGVVLGQGTPMERRKRLREYRWSSYRGYAGLEKMSSYLNTEPIQGVFQTYTGRCWKAWEYRRWVEEGLISEIKDPFEAVKWQQVLGGEGILRKLKDQWNQRVERAQELWTEEKLVSLKWRWAAQNWYRRSNHSWSRTKHSPKHRPKVLPRLIRMIRNQVVVSAICHWLSVFQQSGCSALRRLQRLEFLSCSVA